MSRTLITAKLNACEFTVPAVRLIHDYLSNRKTTTKIVIIIVPGQKYYLVFHKGQLLVHFFLIFFWRMSFFVVKVIDISSYADDSTRFIMENNIDNVIASSEQVPNIAFYWFKNNRLKNNVDKCHII